MKPNVLQIQGAMVEGEAKPQADHLPPRLTEDYYGLPKVRKCPHKKISGCRRNRAKPWKNGGMLCLGAARRALGTAQNRI